MFEDQDQEASKRSPWRPTDYDPSYCDKVVEWGSQGKSRAWIAAELGCVRNTLKNWEAAHPDFLTAMERAKILEQQWWEEKGQANISAQHFQAAMWSRSMAARFPDEWRETSDRNVKVTMNQEEALKALE